MKHGYRIQLILMTIILNGTAMIMAFLADSVPISFSGTSVSDVGSKYENLLFPVFSRAGGSAAKICDLVRNSCEAASSPL